MEKYRKEINQILDTLIKIYSDIKEYDKEKILNKKIKKIKEILQSQIYDKKLIADVLIEEKIFLQNLLDESDVDEESKLKDYDREYFEEDMLLINTLWDGILEGLLDEK